MSASPVAPNVELEAIVVNCSSWDLNDNKCFGDTDFIFLTIGSPFVITSYVE